MEKDIKIENFENKTIISFLNFTKEEEKIISEISLDFFRSRGIAHLSQNLLYEEWHFQQNPF